MLGTYMMCHWTAPHALGYSLHSSNIEYAEGVMPAGLTPLFVHITIIIYFGHTLEAGVETSGTLIPNDTNHRRFHAENRCIPLTDS